MALNGEDFLLFLQGMEKNGETARGEAPVRLEPVLTEHYTGFGNGVLGISLKIGRDKMYKVQSLQRLLEMVRYRTDWSYGKYLTVNHGRENFDTRSRALLDLMEENLTVWQGINLSQQSRYYSSTDQRLGNELILRGTMLDRVFDLYREEGIEALNGQLLQLQERDPEMTLEVSRQGRKILLKLAGHEWNFYEGQHSLYAVGLKTMLRCSRAFADRIGPVCSRLNLGVSAEEKDVPGLAAYLLPRLEGLMEITDPEGILAAVAPESCVPCYYFDMEDELLTCRLSFRYGDRELGEERQPGQVYRNILQEDRAAAALRQDFYRELRGRWVQRGEPDAFGYLTEKLEPLRQLGEVFISPRLRALEVPQDQTPVLSLSMREGMLELELDTGGFPPEELEALYSSLITRQKYYRLKDGRYLPLNGSAYESLAEAAHLTQLTGRELKQGKVKLPPFRAMMLEELMAAHPELRVQRDQAFRKLVRQFQHVENSDIPLPQGFEGVLRNYQETGFRWLETLRDCGFGGILADEMGLGKTVQVIADFAAHPEGRHLVVCPASLLLNWMDECARFAPQLRAETIAGTAAARKARLLELKEQAPGTGPQVLVTSYDLLKRDVDRYEGLALDTVVLDEGQYIKNSSTKVSKAVKQLDCRHRVVLTGTPLENRLSELWNLFDFLMPGYLYSQSRFTERLEKPVMRSGDPQAAEQLRRMVQPFMLRRKKQDVLRELPPKIEHVHRISLSEEERKVYHAAVNEAVRTLSGESDRLQILAAFTRLRQICCDPGLCFQNYEGPASKLEACIELIRSMTENGHQVLLFSGFTSMLDRIRRELDLAHITSFTLQGSTPREKRAKLVKDFNNGGAQVFLISLKAGGTGLNLTAADVVIHYDPWWNLAAQNQATDRTHRIGQKNCVQVYCLIAQGSIEEKIRKLQEKKAELLETVSSEENLGSWDAEELLKLLE